MQHPNLPSQDRVATIPQEWYIPQPTIDQLLESAKDLSDIHELLLEFNVFLRTKMFPPENQDLPRIVTLYKVGFGPNWVPNKEFRQYIRVMALQATAILVTSPLAPPTVVTIPALTYPSFWLPFDFPDQSSFSLDVTASANQLNIYTRLTNVPVE